MKRREFIAGFGGAAVAWPAVARAPQGERARRIGVLMTQAHDPEGQSRVSAFSQALHELGWDIGRDVHIDYRWGTGNPAQISKDVLELLALAPNAVLIQGGSGVSVMLRVTRDVPIVFTTVVDPVGAGYVDSLARPGGNATGFTSFEFGVGGKWLELLKELSPGINRVAVLRDSALSSGVGQFAAIQSVAPSLGMEVTPINVTDVDEIERVVTNFARSPNDGLVVTGSALADVHSVKIVGLAARLRLPAVYWTRAPVNNGGLISYGADPIDQFRRAAAYVDRILKGEKPSDLPVQNPTKYELVINLKTARALGLTVPPTLLARADEVIE